ncbi:MAG: hypothetical protein A2888_00410, partial [Chlamydiae bacterium RIFCSPLOWO2_01_FULL_28_7]
MDDFKMTKNGLRDQQNLLKQLNTYLPTLRLKKTLLMVEVNQTTNEIDKLNKEKIKIKTETYDFCSILTSKNSLNPLNFVKIDHVSKSYENIAGVEIPKFERVVFEKEEYFLLDTPIYFDEVILKIMNLISISEKINVENEKKMALMKELKDVSIRVNLFEKILIPRTERNIKKIKIFLSDQELAAVSQAKV